MDAKWEVTKRSLDLGKSLGNKRINDQRVGTWDWKYHLKRKIRYHVIKKVIWKGKTINERRVRRKYCHLFSKLNYFEINSKQA